jgi:predicted aldo/keto reductase-like oxidoreductase
MFCPSCGVKVNDQDQFCTYCGKSLTEGRKSLAAEEKEMERLRNELGKVFCRRCDYCQPCTAGIPISLVLDTKSIVEKTSPSTIFSGHMGEELEKAADCTECGDCEERCPYHLPIRELLPVKLESLTKRVEEGNF